MWSRNRDDRIGLIIASFAGLLSLACNEVVLAYLFAPDGDLSSGLRWRVRLVQLAMAGVAAIAFASRRNVGKNVVEIARRAPSLFAFSIGTVVVAAMLVAVELGFHAWNVIAERSSPHVVVSYSEPLWKKDVVCHSRKTVGERVVYDVTYTMDDNGRRTTPASAGREGGRHLLFFGCSYTFGQGVNDAETLPNGVANLLPGWHVTNFAYPGHGPVQTLEQLDSGDSLEPFLSGDPILIYTFIPNHVRRVIGSMRVATEWGRSLAYYAIRPDGRLVQSGTLETGSPFRSAVYRWLAREPVLKYFDVDLPIRIANSHLDHAAAVIAASRDRFEGRVKAGRFVVVVYPDRPGEEFSGGRIVPFIERRGITVFDYSARLDTSNDYWIEGDTHSTAAAHARVAEWLSEDLTALMSR